MWDRLHNRLLILIMKNKTFGVTCCLGWKKEGRQKFWKDGFTWECCYEVPYLENALYETKFDSEKAVGWREWDSTTDKMHYLPRRSELPSNTWPHRTVLIGSPFPAPTAHHLHVLWLRPNSSGLLALYPLTNVPTKHCIAYLKMFISVTSAYIPL